MSKHDDKQDEESLNKTNLSDLEAIASVACCKAVAEAHSLGFIPLSERKG